MNKESIMPHTLNLIPRVYGLSQPEFIAAYLEEHEQAGPYVIQTQESFFDSIEEFFLFFNPKRRVYKLPLLDPLFASRTVSLTRLDWLYQASVQKEGSQDVFLCSQKSLMQKTMPESEFKKNTISLERGSKNPSDDDLFRLGYLPSVRVESAGFFSRKGSILDIFSPGCFHPIRIEIFEESVSSIRLFDAQSQLSLYNLSKARLAPALEVIFDSESRFRAIKKLKQLKNLPDYFIKKLAEGLFFPEVSLMVPFFYEKFSSPLNFFQSDFLFLDHEFYQEKNIRFSNQNQPQETNLKKSYQQVSHEDSSDSFKNSKSLRGQSHSFEDVLKNNFYFKEIKKPKAISKFYPLIEEGKGRMWEAQLLKHPPSWDLFKEERPPFIFISVNGENVKEQLRFQIEKRGFKCIECEEEELQWSVLKEEQFQNPDKIHIVSNFLPESFKTPESLFLRGDKLIGRISSQSRKEKIFPFSKAFQFSEIKEGDLIVDQMNGVGMYKGLKTFQAGNITQEYVELEYKDQNKLYIPVSKVHRLFRFKTSFSKNSDKAVLDQLGASRWNEKMAGAKTAIKKKVLDLLKLYSVRSQTKRPAFNPKSLELIRFEKEFPFEETPDQMKAIQDIFGDMSSEKPMDRLIIGDSGYGKTEVSMRAVFKAVEDGFQAAFLSPTTILSLQHFKSFQERFSGFPVRIELLNRLTPKSKIKQILQDTYDRKVDVLIGSHRLLSSDVRFKNLGLLVVDEEHRFGVMQKEKLKKLNMNIDCIYMSATPIPRTLSMSLNGVKDISVLNTPPKNRKPPRVFISSFQEDKIKQAVQFEVKRGGQVIFVHNRVHSLDEMYKKLKHLLPNVSICKVHGRMSEGELESNILKFFNFQCDMLLCTAIIETGMDFERANTIIINNAHQFGLSQLYQLKGRVGRRALASSFCYFVLPEHLISNPSIIERFNFLQTHSESGSGYQAARYDLERRGGGEFLGEKQSGLIDNIGYDLYLEMLEDHLHPENIYFEPEIILSWSSYIPSSYIPHSRVRLMYYKYLCDLEDMSQIEKLETEWRDSFGPLPEEVKNLLGEVLIKNRCKNLKITELKVLKNHLYLKFEDSQKKILLPKQFSWVTVYNLLEEL